MEQTLEEEIKSVQNGVMNFLKHNSTSENKLDLEKALVFGYYIEKETIPTVFYNQHVNNLSILNIPVD